MKKEIYTKIATILENQYAHSHIDFINNIIDGDGIFVYPHENKLISRNLTGEQGTFKILDYLLKNNDRITDYHEYFKGLIGNGYFNPNKDYQLSSYYHKNETFEEFNLISSFIKNNRRRNIVHVGNKGSGKTALQNCWLAEHHKDLEREHVFWVRCDGHKLYKLWFKGIESNELDQADAWKKLVTIEDYFDLQLLYVFCKNCTPDKSDLFSKILYEIRSLKLEYPYQVSREFANDFVNKLVYDGIMSERNKININEININDSRYSYALDDVMLKSQTTYQREKNRWVSLSKAIQKFLTNKGYFVLKILDGMDNIDLSEKGESPFYSHMLDNATSFVLRVAKEGQLHFTAMREKTYIDLRGHHSIQEDTVDFCEPYIIEQNPVCFKTILKKRVEYALINNPDFAGSVYGKILEMMHISVSNRQSSLSHHNLRTFLHNKLSLASQVYYRLEQLQDFNTNLDAQIKNLEPRNKFLNGRLFLRTSKEKTLLTKELGLFNYNIFYFDLNRFPCSNIGQWIGLCCTRAFQLLIYHQRLRQIDIVHFLVEKFTYPERYVISVLNQLKSFGLIDTKYDEDNDCILLEISEKGRFVFADSYANIDTMYYFSLDSPVPLSLIENKCISSHNNSFRAKTHYPYCSISSVISFYVFLKIVHSNEISNLESFSDSRGMIIDTPINAFDLPIFRKVFLKKLLKSGLRILDSCDNADLRRINDFVQTMQG